jgi:hypothetical protein
MYGYLLDVLDIDIHLKDIGYPTLSTQIQIWTLNIQILVWNIQLVYGPGFKAWGTISIFFLLAFSTLGAWSISSHKIMAQELRKTKRITQVNDHG